MSTISEQEYLLKLAQLWQQQWPESIPREPVYPLGKKPICQYLADWAERRPEKVAVHFYGYDLSYAQWQQLSNQFAHWLSSVGVKKGDPVAIIMPNCPQFMIAFMGILKIGAIYHPVSPLAKEMELAHQLGDCVPKVVLCFDQLLPLVQSVCEKLAINHIMATSLSELVNDNNDIPLPDLMQVPKCPLPDPVEDFFPCIAQHSKHSPTYKVQLDDIAAVNYTGGTTGLPKGCIHTHAHMIYTCASYMPAIMGKEIADITSINFLPQFWIAGEDSSLLFPVFSGSTQVLLCRWDCQAYMSAVEKYQVAMGTLLIDNVDEILNHPNLHDFDLTCLTLTPCVSFIKKLTLQYRQQWQELTGCILFESSYGMTETNTCDTFTAGLQENDFDLSFAPSFVGLPVAGTELKICDFATGKLVPLGSEGEICIRSPALFSGYWNKPELNQQAFDNGWFHTGDIGEISVDGFIRYLGRRKEMIKVNGMSVFPTELETMLGRHQDIQASAVIARADADTGQKPVAFVVLRANSKQNEQQLTAWCKEVMAIYKVPEFKFVESLPMTATGKVIKKELENWL